MHLVNWNLSSATPTEPPLSSAIRLIISYNLKLHPTPPTIITSLLLQCATLNFYYYLLLYYIYNKLALSVTSVNIEKTVSYREKHISCLVNPALQISSTFLFTAFFTYLRFRFSSSSLETFSSSSIISPAYFPALIKSSHELNIPEKLKSIPLTT